MLAFWTGGDAALMDEIFRSSGLMRENWYRKQSGATYGAITLQKAIDGIMKLSITLDTLTARILKLSSDSRSRIEPTPFYSWWNTADRRADSAVAPVAHEISPDHRF